MVEEHRATFNTKTLKRKECLLFLSAETLSRFLAMQPSCRNVVTARVGWERGKKEKSPLTVFASLKLGGKSMRRLELRTPRSGE